MAIQGPHRPGALRIAFLTVPMFQRLSAEEQRKIKVRALRVLERHARYACREDSFRPDAVFYIRKNRDNQWELHKEPQR